MEPHIYGVAEVNQLVKSLLDGTPALQGVFVRGELSNYKIYPSGHHYFTLKDSEGALRCVMFRGQASRLRFRPENGMKAVASGRITVFPRDGAYQLYCDTLTAEGAGDLAVAFQQLKEKLWKEGLFDPAHKKPLPPYPERIAVVTSAAGAAVHIMFRILRRRSSVALWVLSWNGSVGEYLARWRRDVAACPRLLFCPEGCGLLVKKILFRRKKQRL